VLTGQSILLVGMMTEAVVTPFLSDRDLALKNVRYVLNAAGSLAEDFRPSPDGVIVKRAHQVLGEAVDLLERIVDDGLLNAIADGTFGLMKRPAHKGKGADGVIVKADTYVNPASELLDDALTSAESTKGTEAQV
jgi:beta-lysine 5,6-aminomutase alpha subunit